MGNRTNAFARAACALLSFVLLGGCSKIEDRKRTDRQLPGGWTYTIESWRELYFQGGGTVCRVSLKHSSWWSSERVGEFTAPDKSVYSQLCGLAEPVQFLDIDGRWVITAGAVIYRKNDGRWSAWSPWRTEAASFIRQYLAAGESAYANARSVAVRRENGKWTVEMELNLASRTKLFFVDDVLDEDRTRQANTGKPAAPFPAGLELEIQSLGGWHSEQDVRLAPPEASLLAKARITPGAAWRRVELGSAAIEIRAAHGTEDPRTGVIHVREAGQTWSRSQALSLTIARWHMVPVSGLGNVAMRLQHSPKWMPLEEGTQILDPVAARPYADTPVSSISNFAVSPDKRILAVRTLGVGLFHASTGQGIRPLDSCSTWLPELSFSPDSKLVLSHGQGMGACIWEAESGKVKADGIKACDGAAQAWSFAPDGALAAGCQGRVEIVSTAGQKTDRTFEMRGETVSALAGSNAGGLLAAGTQSGLVRLWDYRSGRVQAEWRAAVGGTQTLRFDGDGRTLTAVSYYQKSETRLVADPAKIVPTPEGPQYFISKDGQLLKQSANGVDFILTALGTISCCRADGYQRGAWIVTRPGSLRYAASELGDDYAYLRSKDGRLTPLRVYRDKLALR